MERVGCSGKLRPALFIKKACGVRRRDGSTEKKIVQEQDPFSEAFT